MHFMIHNKLFTFIELDEKCYSIRKKNIVQYLFQFNDVEI